MAGSGLSGRWGSAMRMAMMVVGLVCLAAVQARADGSAGRAAFLAGDYRGADRDLRPAAGQGDAEAALLLGRMAENGLGRPVDDREAWAWYKRAADGGQAEAMVRAADFAWIGRGTVLDRRQAYLLFKRAAEASNPRAIGRIGEMALWGEGRPADAAQGVAWLRQAADADDPEALALLDDLAAERRVEPVPMGTASPVDPFAQRSVESLREAVAWMSLGGEVTALVRPDGSVRLTLPELSAVVGGQNCRFGTVRLVFRNSGDDGADFDLLLPSRLGLADAVVSLSGQRVSGRWSFRQHGPVVLHGEAVAGRFDAAALGWLSFHGLSMDRRVGGGAVTERMSLADLSGRTEVGGHRLRLAARRLSAGGEIRGAASAASMPGQWGVARILLGLLSGEDTGSLPAMVAASGNIAGEGLGVEDDGVPLMAAQTLESGLALADLDKPLAGAHWSYVHDGWSAGGRFSAPARVTLGLGGERLPVAALWRLAGGAWPAWDDLAGALSAAGSRISIDEAGAFGNRWSLAATGALLPANGGLTLAADVKVAGLEEMLAASPRFDPAAGDLLRRVGQPVTDGKGRSLTRFQLVVPPGAPPQVNGKPLENQVFP